MIELEPYNCIECGSETPCGIKLCFGCLTAMEPDKSQPEKPRLSELEIIDALERSWENNR